MSKDNEVSAFPHAHGNRGMTLRDYFAAKASNEDIRSIIDKRYAADATKISRAEARYMHADLMLAERAK